MWLDALVLAGLPCAVSFYLCTSQPPWPTMVRRGRMSSPASPAPPVSYAAAGRPMEAAQLTTSGFPALDCLKPGQKIPSSLIKAWPLADGLPVQWIHGQPFCGPCPLPPPNTVSPTDHKPLPSTFASWLHSGRNPLPYVDLLVESANVKRLQLSSPLSAQSTSQRLPAQTGDMTIPHLPRSGVLLLCSHTWPQELPRNLT